MTVQNVRAYVREYLDLEVEDLPDSLIDPWIAEAFRRIIRARQEWPAYETVATLVTDGGFEYDLGLREVRSVFDQNYGPLNSTDFALAQARYRHHASGRPRTFSTWAGKVRLWPAPSAGLTFHVSGYREPADPLASGVGTAFDLPHPDAYDLVVSYVMHKAYLREDEPELATIHKAQFDEGLAIIAKDETDAPTGVPVVLNGAGRQGVLPGRLAFPWE